jgi:hypothetical protein
MSRDYYYPGRDRKPEGEERDANSWGKWLRQSAQMREKALGYLRERRESGRGERARTFDAISGGDEKGGGKVFISRASRNGWRSETSRNFDLFLPKKYRDMTETTG